MRLVRCWPDGSLTLTRDFPTRETPPYAILSHTWSPNEDNEVHYHDMIRGTASIKPGFQKLLFCSQQAAADGFDHFWIDTCCINKASEPELSQAIRSMYRWYQNAEICYVYLSDVHNDARDPAGIDVDALIRSQWFERGWTVQELIAPYYVEFYSSAGKLLGSKDGLQDFISLKTGIPSAALQGKKMSYFTRAERLSWLERRYTRREEDMVYAAFGFFDVHIPIMYGEGIKNARERLERALASREARNCPSFWYRISMFTLSGLVAMSYDFDSRQYVLGSEEPASEKDRPFSEHAPIRVRELQTKRQLQHLARGDGLTVAGYEMLDQQRLKQTVVWTLTAVSFMLLASLLVSACHNGLILTCSNH